MTKYYVDPGMLFLILTLNKVDNNNVHEEKNNNDSNDENRNEDDGENYAGGNLPPLSPWKNI